MSQGSVELWRRLLLRALCATRRSRSIATTAVAGGGDAPDAGASETQCEPQSGSSMSDDVLVARTRRELDDAIERHMQALYGNLVTVDWMLVAENVVEDPKTEEFVHLLHPAVSEQMSSFKLHGMSWQALRHFQALTS